MRQATGMGERAANSGPAAGISPVQQMLASGTGALITSVFVTPLDVVKIRLQAQQTPLTRAVACEASPWGCVSRPSKCAVPCPLLQLKFAANRYGCSAGKCFLYCNGLMDHLYVCRNGSSCSGLYRTQTHFSGTLDAFVKITRHEGARSLWSGLPPTLVMAVPATVIYFTCYDQLRDYLRYSLGLHGNHVPLIAGALARLGAVTVISPLELVRTKMQSRKLTYAELNVCIRTALARGGWLSLWKGWGPTVLRDVPFSALYWFNYELVKARLHEHQQQHHLTSSQTNFSISFAAGAISGSVAAILTLPFDVVKTRRQIQLGEMETLGVPLARTSSTWHILKNIWTESGHRGLFAGFLPRVIKVAPACAIMISSYEFGKAFFQEMNLDREQRQS